MRKRAATTVTCVGGSLLALVLAGCGGSKGGSPTGPSSLPPTQPAVQVLPTQTFSNLVPESSQASELSIEATGVTAEIVANWTFGYNDVDVFVTSTACATNSYDDLFLQLGSCASLGRGTSVNQPERVNVSLSPGRYRVYVASSALSVSPEAGTLAITLRR